MITLDSNINTHVNNPRVIEATLGQADRKMMIFSGIALPEWSVNDDEHVYHEDVVVNLRRTVLAVEQATVTVGLASIGNDDTVFLIAADTAQIDVDPQSQELLLRVALALQGEHTGLNRFGYQVVAVVTTQATGISGTIRWRRDIFDAANVPPGQIAQMFQITANRVERVTPPQGFVYDRYTPVAYGVTTGFSHTTDEFIVPYEIPGAPYNQPLVVNVQVGAGFHAHGTPGAGQISGPNPVVLTVGQPGVTNVDFRVSAMVVR
jgi:hypothetical protein